jgi:hypothetical protein
VRHAVHYYRNCCAQNTTEDIASKLGQIAVYTDVLYDPLVDPLNPKQRTILLQEDSWYPGTCEADIICDTEAIAQAEAEVCVTRLLQ